MLSFGLARIARFDGRTVERLDDSPETFYRELRPITDLFDEETLAVSALDRNRLLAEGADPVDAMSAAAEWVTEVAGSATPVIVAYPLSFDWSWLYWYFMAFSRHLSPFGFSNCFDMKTAFAVRYGRPIAAAGMSSLPNELRSSKRHVHHGLADALEQAEIFFKIRGWDAYDQ